MLLDTSAIVAVILREAGWESLGHRIDEAAAITVSSASLPETHLVLTGRLGTDALPLIDAFLSETKAEVVPFTEAQWRLAAAGFLRFGKGRHPGRRTGGRVALVTGSGGDSGSGGRVSYN
jgi:ribonuclease VapC